MFYAHYAKPLRTIGQALEALRVKDIDIESQGEGYVVRGNMQTELQLPAPQQEQENKIRLIWGKLRARRADENGGPRSEPSFVPLELRYTTEDIERLEREGQARRHNSGGMPNSHSVSQVLRAAGGYVENKRARLVGVTCKDQAVTIQYEKNDGERSIEEFTFSSLYDYCVHMYMQRAGRS